MSAAIAAAGIGAVASIGTGIMSSKSGSNAAKKSSEQQRQDQLMNMQIMNEGRIDANKRLDPYSQFGDAAQNQLRYELGLGGTGTGSSGSLNQPYGMEQYQKDVGYTPMVNDLKSLQATPGYNFQLQQGLQSANNSAAARGSLLSGKQLKGLNNYAQGVASQGYQAAWERAQNAYQNAFSRNQSQTQQRYNQLMQPTGIGFNAANAQGSNTMSAANNITGGNQNVSNNVSNNAMYAADQYQSGLSNVNKTLQQLIASPDIQNAVKRFL